MKIQSEIILPDDFLDKFVTKEYLEKRLKELLTAPPPVKPPVDEEENNEDVEINYKLELTAYSND